MYRHTYGQTEFYVKITFFDIRGLKYIFRQTLHNNFRLSTAILYGRKHKTSGFVKINMVFKNLQDASYWHPVPSVEFESRSQQHITKPNLPTIINKLKIC